MKKSIKVFIAVVLVAISIFSTVLPAIADTAVKYGDINNNGTIDTLDYVLLKRAYFGTFQLNDVQQICGDCNRNGTIDSLDYVLLKRAYFGTYNLPDSGVIAPDENDQPTYDDDGYYTEVVKP